jgi:two-component system NtrC family sensor kinase
MTTNRKLKLWEREQSSFDETAGKITAIVIYWLYTLVIKALGDVNEKMLSRADFNPIVSVKISKTIHKVELLVTDNGNGIPQKILDKIFQPFFTTKPAGEGTGLGLSLSYDIVKAHGGELKVESEVDSGNGKTSFTNFTITLPILNKF